MDWKPDVAFNLLEEFQGIVTYDQYVVAFLELMRLPYTGCNPRGMMISRDKVLSKQILAYHRIPTARYALLPRKRRYREPRKLKFPLFVKSATEDASLGISQASIVYDGQKLRERVEFIHEQTNSDALVEEYIEGRELYVGVDGQRAADHTSRCGNWIFGTLPDVMSIATRKVKWDRKYQKRHGIGTGPGPRPAGRRCRCGWRPLVRRIYRALIAERLRAHRPAAAAGRQRLRARGQRQSEPRADRGLRDVGAGGGHGLRRGAAADHAVRAELRRGLARDLSARRAAPAVRACGRSVWKCVRSYSVWQSMQRSAVRRRVEPLHVDRLVADFADAVAAVRHAQQGGLDRAQFLEVAIDFGQADVDDQVGERFVLEVAHRVGDLQVVLGVALAAASAGFPRAAGCARSRRAARRWSICLVSGLLVIVVVPANTTRSIDRDRRHINRGDAQSAAPNAARPAHAAGQSGGRSAPSGNRASSKPKRRRSVQPHRIEDAVEVVDLVLDDAGMEAVTGAVDGAPVRVVATIAQLRVAADEAAQAGHGQAAFPGLVALVAEQLDLAG